MCDNNKSDIIYCSNCNKQGHINKKCNEPATSYGIICIKFDNSDEINKLKNEVIDNINKNEEITITESDGIEINDLNEDQYIFSQIKDKFKFLMIKRKNSIGFLEFMRGHYKPNNIDNIIYLFQQMTIEEINKIKDNDFDYLWDELWLNGNNKKDFRYLKSKELYNELKYSEVELNLDFYINNVEPIYSTPEWGFPKGRKNINESDIECALREFEEETNYNRSDIILMDNIKPIVEEMTGTDGKKYIHIYYLAFLKDNDCPRKKKDVLNHSNEVGDIEWFSYYNSINYIRDYHKEKKYIITSVFIYIINSIIKNINLNK